MERSISRQNQSLGAQSLLEINGVPYEDVATVTSWRRACFGRDDENRSPNRNGRLGKAPIHPRNSSLLGAPKVVQVRGCPVCPAASDELLGTTCAATWARSAA